MTEVIKPLRGHHEPQEEVAFHTILERLASDTESPTMLELGRFWGYYSNCAKRRIPRLRLVMLELNLPAWKSVATTRSSTAWRLRSCMRRSKPSTSGSSPCAGTPTASHTHPPAQRRRDHRRSGDRRTGSPALRRPGRRDGDADRRGPGPGCPQDPIPSPLHPPPFDLRGSAHPSALPELSQVRRSPHRRRALGDGVLQRRWLDRRPLSPADHDLHAPVSLVRAGDSPFGELEWELARAFNTGQPPGR